MSLGCKGLNRPGGRQISRLLAVEVCAISGSNAGYTMFRGSVKGFGCIPIIRISRKTDLTVIHDFMFDDNMVIGIGNSSATSTSKIIKITAIRKNRDEKGSCAEFYGSNPHSKGDLFFGLHLFSLKLMWLPIIG